LAVQNAPIVDGLFAEDIEERTAVVLALDIPFLRVEGLDAHAKVDEEDRKGSESDCL